MGIDNMASMLGMWIPTMSEMLQWLVKSTATVIYDFAFTHPIVFALLLTCMLQWWYIRTLRWRARGARLQGRFSNWAKKTWLALQTWLNRLQEKIEPMYKKVQAVYGLAFSE